MNAKAVDPNNFRARISQNSHSLMEKLGIAFVISEHMGISKEAKARFLPHNPPRPSSTKTSATSHKN